MIRKCESKKLNREKAETVAKKVNLAYTKSEDIVKTEKMELERMTKSAKMTSERASKRKSNLTRGQKTPWSATTTFSTILKSIRTTPKTMSR